MKHSGLRHACLSFWVRNTGTASSATGSQRLQSSGDVSPARGLSEVLLGEDAATVVIGRIPFLVGDRTEGPHSLLPIGSSLHGAAHPITTSRQEPRESASKTDVTGLCDIILEVASHHCCHLVLIRSKSQACPHSRKGINTQKHEPAEAGLTGAVLISVYTPSPGSLLSHEATSEMSLHLFDLSPLPRPPPQGLTWIILFTGLLGFILSSLNSIPHT